MDQTVKCPICGKPYKFMAFYDRDQSACPSCRTETEKNTSITFIDKMNAAGGRLRSSETPSDRVETIRGLLLESDCLRCADGRLYGGEKPPPCCKRLYP